MRRVLRESAPQSPPRKVRAPPLWPGCVRRACTRCGNTTGPVWPAVYRVVWTEEDTRKNSALRAGLCLTWSGGGIFFFGLLTLAAKEDELILHYFVGIAPLNARFDKLEGGIELRVVFSGDSRFVPSEIQIENGSDKFIEDRYFS